MVAMEVMMMDVVEEMEVAMMDMKLPFDLSQRYQRLYL
jgi:hypothetical protein